MALNLDIGEFNITSDRHNVIVHERYVKEEGGEGLRQVGYYGSIQAALRRILNDVVKKSDAETVHKLLDEIERHKKYIEQLIASVDFNSYRKEVNISAQEIDDQDELSFLD